MRIVLVDDHEELRQSLRRMLERLGLEVVGEAGRGCDAIEVTAGSDPDVVLLDFNLPDQSGAECARTLRARFPHVRLVGWSGEMWGESEMLAAGADAFVLKGGPSDLLLKALARSRIATPVTDIDPMEVVGS
jgi:DNA-binding NarL/FixJ family response regulator